MRILLIEDDARLIESLTYQLEQEGITVDSCTDGSDGLYYMSETAYDLVLLDRMLHPDIDGVDILKEARSQGIGTPVIILTALGQLEDRIDGLDAGADDYIVKPFAFRELMARIRSVGRRPRAWGQVERFTYGGVSLTPAEQRLTGPLGDCLLSKRESDLMEAFMRNPGQILTRDTLLLRVWGPGAEVEGGNLDNYIHFLRRRLRKVSGSLRIATVRGVGYMLEQGGGEEG